MGLELGLPEAIVWRQPLPGPGLGIRIVGEVTQERLDVLREADAIAREELSRAGLDRDIWQCPVVLLADVRSVGAQGDGRTYGHPAVLRLVSSEDAMTADWTRVPYDVLATISTRITNEVREVNRVVLDVTSKPPVRSSGSRTPVVTCAFAGRPVHETTSRLVMMPEPSVLRHHRQVARPTWVDHEPVVPAVASCLAEPSGHPLFLFVGGSSKRHGLGPIWPTLLALRGGA